MFRMKMVACFLVAEFVLPHGAVTILLCVADGLDGLMLVGKVNRPVVKAGEPAVSFHTWHVQPQVTPKHVE